MLQTHAHRALTLTTLTLTHSGVRRATLHTSLLTGIMEHRQTPTVADVGLTLTLHTSPLQGRTETTRCDGRPPAKLLPRWTPTVAAATGKPLVRAGHLACVFGRGRCNLSRVAGLRRSQNQTCGKV